MTKLDKLWFAHVAAKAEAEMWRAVLKDLETKR